MAVQIDSVFSKPKKKTTTVPTFGKLSPSQQEERDRREVEGKFESASDFFPKVSFGGLTADEQAIQDLGLQGDFMDVMHQGVVGGSQLSPMQAFAQSPILQQKVSDAFASGAGGGGGGFPAAIPTTPEELTKLADIEWKNVDFKMGSGSQAPDWWVGKVPVSADDAGRPDVNYLMTLNAMIPFLSPEDQEAAARALYAADADHFSEYKPESISGGRQVITKAQSLLSGSFQKNPENFIVRDDRYYESRSRAREAINMLSQLREFTVEGNRWKIAPAYTLLQSMLGAMEQYGGSASGDLTVGGVAGTPAGLDRTGGQTPAQLRALLGQLDPLLASASSPEIGGGFASIARMLSQPFFSAGQLNPTRNLGGKLLIGASNPLLQF